MINDVRYILQLPLIWSIELMIIYVLLLLFNPNWVSIPLHIYFLFVGTQTLYSYLKAKSVIYRNDTGSMVAVKLFASVITAATAICYIIYLVNINVEGDRSESSAFWQKQLYWISNDAIGYTLLIKLVSTIQIGKFHLVCILYAAMIIYDCFFVFASDVMITVATRVENPMKFIFPHDLTKVITEPAPK